MAETKLPQCLLVKYVQKNDLAKRLPVWFLAMAVNRLAASYANAWATWYWTHKREEKERPLPDVLLHRLPRVPYWVPEAFVGLALVSSLRSKERLLRFLTVSTPAMALRALVICTTFYPTPMLEAPHWGYGAYDLLYSGHTVMLFSAAQTPLEYLVGCFGALSILGARHHYTADVLMAVVVVELLKRVLLI